MPRITIPPAALEAGARAMFEVAYGRSPVLPDDDDNLGFAKAYARAAFEAMVGAWPGMHQFAFSDNRGTFPALILPLTENTDDQ